MNAAQLINQTSGDFEYYTPQPIIEAARRTMGVIHMDPASSAVANERVGAFCYIGQEDDGLSHSWRISSGPSNVWMNHPFGRGLNQMWIDKLMLEYAIGNVSQACCITFACTSEGWFRPLLDHAQCFLVPRTNYLLPDGSVKVGVTKGSVVTYIGPNVEKFAEEFAAIGVIKIPFQRKLSRMSNSGTEAAKLSTP